jgi:hypothetical protein
MVQSIYSGVDSMGRDDREWCDSCKAGKHEHPKGKCNRYITPTIACQCPI